MSPKQFLHFDVIYMYTQQCMCAHYVLVSLFRCLSSSFSIYAFSLWVVVMFSRDVNAFSHIYIIVCTFSCCS